MVPAHTGVLASDPHKGVVPVHTGVLASDPPHKGVVPAHLGVLAFDSHKGVVPAHFRVPTSYSTRGWSLLILGSQALIPTRGDGMVPAHPGVPASDLPRFGFVNGALGYLTQAGGPGPQEGSLTSALAI